MADFNSVQILGRLTQNPEYKTTAGGPVANFGIATGRKYRKADGSFSEETTFVDMSAWGKTADLVNRYLHKGSLVFVAGRLKLEKWQDRVTGQGRSKLTVVCNNVQFLDRKPLPEEQTEKPVFAPSNWPEPGEEPPF